MIDRGGSSLVGSRAYTLTEREVVETRKSLAGSGYHFNATHNITNLTTRFQRPGYYKSA